MSALYKFKAHCIYEALLCVQDLREKIDQHYRVRLILDNLPITTYDLEKAPESIRPGFEVRPISKKQKCLDLRLFGSILRAGWPVYLLEVLAALQNFACAAPHCRIASC